MGDIQTYMMEKNPSWSVPEKRRLKKFVKRATSRQSPAPSTPSSQQSELTESTNNELDSRSERSRSSRLKGITNRLFGGGNNSNNNNNNARKVKPGTSQPPVYEIQTTINAEVNTTEELFTEPTTVSIIQDTSGESDREMNNVEPTVPPRATESIEGQLNIDNDKPAATSRLIDDMYSDENDGAIVKGERCCFLWCC